DAGFHGLEQALGRRALLLGAGQAHRRDPDLVAALELALGLGPPAVDPDLPGAHQLVDQAARRTLELAEQEVVQALPGTVVRHPDGMRAPALFSFRTRRSIGAFRQGHWQP